MAGFVRLFWATAAMNQFKVCGFNVCSEISADDTKELVEQVCSKTLVAYSPHRDNRRTLSARFQFKQDDFVIKIPRARNSRFWERMLTLFRGSEVARLYQGMLDLKRLGVSGTYPVLMAEKKILGITVDGFLIYNFLEGRPSTAVDAPAIAKAVLGLHEMGYVRRDIHLGNFLITPDNRVGMIDFRLSKPRLLKQFSLDLELVQMLRAIPSTGQYIPKSRMSSHTFQTAKKWYAFTARVRGLRKKVKSLFVDYKSTR